MYTQLSRVRISSLGFLFITCLLTSSCATRYNFNTSTVVPAAEGSVKVKKDKNNNYRIDLNVKNLADPQKLSPSRQLYIVWMQTEQSGAKNIGQLETSNGFLSGKLKSSLQTVTAFQPREFFISAEDHATAQYPGGETVLSTGTIR